MAEKNIDCVTLVERTTMTRPYRCCPRILEKISILVREKADYLSLKKILISSKYINIELHGIVSVFLEASNRGLIADGISSETNISAFLEDDRSG